MKTIFALALAIVLIVVTLSAKVYEIQHACAGVKVLYGKVSCEVYSGAIEG
jgi:hypothetical protein